ncbi:L-aspartate oxidase [Cesiribacter sp. SM1]|uniref:L-aspartate oxidase n=1 Tax=Cesiribacter sp. SM1 TaxID=2861196 RepID=UPI001CD26F50|nr:L-aspartate oxidase [Cesiribacter sp. SM1]
MARYDCLIIGSGVAGLSAALQAASWGKVAVLCKAEAACTNTNLAQGGLAAVLSPEDSPARHAADTLAAGSWHNNQAVVKLLAQEAPHCIQALLRLGVPFDTDEQGRLALGLEGGHSHSRIVHARDQTGFHIQQKLLEAVKQSPNIELLEYHMAVELLLERREEKSRCVGAKVLDLVNNRLKTMGSGAVILASGGAGQLYQHTTNPAVATGDGIALAYHAGAELADLEFIQFHPTTLYDPGKAAFLISEAVRGFGAELVLPGGTPFMHQYHRRGSLAPRDVVAQAMHHEMQHLQLPCLFLDLRHLPQAQFAEKFPTIAQKLQERGIDVRSDLVPVVPAAHYMCGGVKTDLWGQSTLAGLYACGECACTGLHGANRLASSSLPEGWVMGRRAAEHAAMWRQPLVNNLFPASAEVALALQEGEVAATALAVKQQLQKLMWQWVGIVRSGEGLIHCQQQVEDLYRQAENFSTCLPEVLELKNLLTLAKLVIQACIDRKESLGGHYLKSAPFARPACTTVLSQLI